MIGHGSAITAVTPSLTRFKALRLAAGVAKNISDAITMIIITTGSVNFRPPTVLCVSSGLLLYFNLIHSWLLHCLVYMQLVL